MAFLTIDPFKEMERFPVSDMYGTEKNIVASFELPGADKKDIELNVTEDFIEVKV